MQGVIVEAVKRLTDISYLARKAARFAEENPNKLMFLDTNIQSDSSLLMKSLTEIEIGNILGIDGRNGINTKWFKKLMNENNGIITYDTLGRFLYRKYTSKFNFWPYTDKNKKVKVSETLLLFRENEFYDDFSPKNFSFICLNNSAAPSFPLFYRLLIKLMIDSAIQRPDLKHHYGKNIA